MKKYFLLFIFSLVACSVTYAQHNVTLVGTCSDSSLTPIKYRIINPFWWSEINPDIFTKVPKKNNLFEIKLNIKNPQVLSIFPPRNSRTQTIYITPGDSVSFQIVPTSQKNKYELVFSGKNAANYNYSLFTVKRFKFKNRPHFKKGNDLNQYKQALLEYKQKQLDSLLFYTENNSVSEEFINYAKAEINNEYVNSLFSPVKSGFVSISSLPSGYLQDAIPEKDEASLNYKTALSYKYIYCYTNNPTSNFDSVYTNIIQHFSGQDKAFLLSAMIGYYALQQKQEYRSGLLQAINEARKYVNEPQYLKYIQKAEEYYTMINHPFPDSVLHQTYLRSFNEDKKITLKELLDQYKGKPIYLDFWASWCFACREDIANSHPVKEYLSKKDVTWIYISRDTDEKAWLKAAKQDSITNNQYLLYDIANSPLLKYLNINFIPRYVLMDAQHNIKEPTAPRPVDSSYESPSTFNKLKSSVQKIIGERNVLTYN